AFRRVGVAVFRGLPVDAGCEVLRFLGVTLRALSGNQFFRGGELVHAAMTRSARGFAENRVCAGCMPGRVDGNALPGVGLHSRLAMARQTFLVCGRGRRSQSQDQSQVNQSNPSREHFNTLLRKSTQTVWSDGRLARSGRAGTPGAPLTQTTPSGTRTTSRR